MASLFPEYKRSTVYALIGTLFHFVVLVLPVIITGGKVKLVYYMFIWFDFPLFLVGTFIPESLRFILHWMSEAAWLCLLGTLMYALVGWFIGRSRDRYLQMNERKGDQAQMVVIL